MLSSVHVHTKGIGCKILLRKYQHPPSHSILFARLFSLQGRVFGLTTFTGRTIHLYHIASSHYLAYAEYGLSELLLADWRRVHRYAPHRGKTARHCSILQARLIEKRGSLAYKSGGFWISMTSEKRVINSTCTYRLRRLFSQVSLYRVRKAKGRYPFCVRTSISGSCVEDE